MQSVIDNVENGNINGVVRVVICSKDGIGAIDRCVRHNIPYKVFKKKDYDSATAMDSDIINVLESYNIDLVVLAGYLNIVSPLLVHRYNRRIINIHPSLIPKYCGMSYYGMRVHEAVIANHEKESGCTVYYVDEGADTGEIIRQERVKVLDTDTPETLQARVLEVEHQLLPSVVAMLCK